MASEQHAKKVKKMHDITDCDMSTQKALEEIDALQNQLDDVEIKASAEIMAIEQKYNKLRKPIQEKRTQLISSIPNFWLTCMMNHPDLSCLLDGAEEEDCLSYLHKIEIGEFDDVVSGYHIKFHFNENPYFENSVLTKEFHFGNDSATSKSTEIMWKNDHHLGQTNVNSEARKPVAGTKRRLSFMKNSFFTWFTDNVDPFTDDIAEDFKDDLWVNPLQYYLVADGQEEDNNVIEAEGETSSSDDEDSGVNPESGSQESTTTANESSIDARNI